MERGGTDPTTILWKKRITPEVPVLGYTLDNNAE